MPRKRKGGNKYTDFIFIDHRLSTQPNTDPSYIEQGIVHVCDSIAVNALREIGSELYNIFGKSGFNSTLFDQARNKCLERLVNTLNDDNDSRIVNIRFETISLDSSLITINAYGTLIKKNPNYNSE